MANFKIDISTKIQGLLLKDINRAIKIIEEELEKIFTEILLFLREKVKDNTPEWNGNLIRSITMGNIRGSGLGIYGSTFTNIIYGQFIETGQPIHNFPNFNNLADWVRSKLKLEGSDLYLVTRVIQRKIANSGIKGHFMFQKGFEDGEREIPKMLDRMMKNVESRLSI